MSLRVLLTVATLFFSISVSAADPAPEPAPEPPQKATSEFSLDGMTAADLIKLRDPFLPPSSVVDGEIPKSELERFPIEQYELVGVVTGPIRMRAMVRAPDSKTYIVTEAMKMGTRSGTVRKITPTSVVVREKQLNVLGQEEDVDAELKMTPKPKGS